MRNDFDELIRYIRGFPLNYTMSDEDVSGTLTTQIAKRDKDYTQLLENHIDLTHARGICKEIHKWLFFWLIISAGIIVIVYTLRIFNKFLAAETLDIIIEAIPILIAALVSIVSTVIAIPLTIANFLFNTKEDDNITTLIQHTQDHDTAGINIFKDRFAVQKSSRNNNNSNSMRTLDNDEQ